ncbi:MAG: response regulator [Methanobacteriota archaeon]
MKGSGPVIVAIDDYSDNLVTVKAFVTDAFPGARVFTAENGRDGIKLARDTNPDVILLDIVMSGMNGFEVCHILKEDPLLQHIPVIFLTALKDDRESRIRALEVGGEAFISKPFEEAEFKAQIRAMIKIKAANVRELREKENLATLVSQRTAELEIELTERRKAEQELRQANQILTQNRAAMLNILADLKEEVESRKQSEEKFRLISENFPDHILIQDTDLRYIWVLNPQLELRQEDMVGKTDYDFLLKEDADKLTSVKMQILETGKKIPYETELTSKSGNHEYFQGEYLPKYNIGGEIDGLIGYFRNISDRKRAERALNETILKLRLLTGLTRHDIFNQVSAIEISLEMMDQTSDLTKIHEYIIRSQKACGEIVATIGFTREYEDFGTVSSGWQRVHMIIEMAQREVSLNSITLENQIPEYLEVYADPTIRKVFTTLIENAIRHGRNVTWIRFSCSHIENFLILICEDNGVGISVGEKERIFDHGFGNHTGIGLFLAREILTITGLSIRETGESGKGARFEILVPAWKFRMSEGDGS